jgi:hypothetical protein
VYTSLATLEHTVQVPKSVDLLQCHMRRRIHVYTSLATLEHTVQVPKPVNSEYSSTRDYC